MLILEYHLLIAGEIEDKESLLDLNEWGTDAVGRHVLEFMDRIFTLDEMVERKYGSDTEIY